jgi:DNA-binding MarR family transcriptional regulator
MNRSHLSACVVHSTAYRRVRRLTELGLVSSTSVEGRKRVRDITLTSIAVDRLERLLEETWFSRMEKPAADPQERLSSNRRRRLDELAALLREYREELDSLAAWEAGAHLSQAISALERC